MIVLGDRRGLREKGRGLVIGKGIVVDLVRLVVISVIRVELLLTISLLSGVPLVDGLASVVEVVALVQDQPAQILLERCSILDPIFGNIVSIAIAGS